LIREEILEKLRDLNYVNDKALARNWARERAETRGYGPKRIEQELRTRGIGPLLIREVIQQAFKELSEKEKAKVVLERKFKGIDINDPKVLSRAAAFLERRGFSGKVISALLPVIAEE
jgi:regulatory protein